MVLCLCPGASFCVHCNCDARKGSLCFLSQVTNPGQALQTLGSAFLNIMWPYELSNGKWLLYPASLKFDGPADARCTLSGALNPLRLHSSSPAGVTSVSHKPGLKPKQQSYTLMCLSKCAASSGWPSPPLPPRRRGSRDHKGQRGKNHSSRGGIR